MMKKGLIICLKKLATQDNKQILKELPTKVAVLFLHIKVKKCKKFTKITMKLHYYVIIGRIGVM